MVNVPKLWNRTPLEYLGLWKTEGRHLKNLDKIAINIASEQTEANLLIGIRKNIMRRSELCKMWIELYNMQRNMLLENPGEALNV